jgi:hypothetical protein
VPCGSLLDVILPLVDAAVLIVSPTIPHVRRAAVLLESTAQQTRWAIVLNRLGPGGETTRIALQRLLGHPITMELPCCPALRDAEDDCRLVTSPLHRWRRAVVRLARAVAAS